MNKLKTTYLIFLVLISTLPINGTTSPLNNNYILSIRWDYILHALIYIPAFALLKSSKFKVQGFKLEQTLNMKLQNLKLQPKPKEVSGVNYEKELSALAIALLLAIGLELIQYILPYRSFNLNDLLANIFGVGIGVILWIIFRNRIILQNS